MAERGKMSFKFTLERIQIKKVEGKQCDGKKLERLVE